MTDHIIKSDVDMAHMAVDLLDTEASQVFNTVVDVQLRFQHRANSVQNLDAMRDELLTRLAEIGILATVDASPCFYGEPPIVEVVGKIAGDAFHTEGLDHEKKQFEVRRATERGEEFLGQKEAPNTRHSKK